MTTVVPELDGIDWDSAIPPCDCEGCENPGDFAVEQRHLNPSNCEEERRTWWICESCYEYIGKVSTLCKSCLVPASIFKT